MKLPFKTKGERNTAFVLVALWALLFLPNLRTNPNWYGDEGEWMEKSWTFIHGTPRIGPIVDDFIFPYPYPPLYMMVNGALLRMFGNDIVVARALGAVTALVAGALLFWIGTRLRDKNFGFLCAAAFLVYSEANINFRWVRSHPMSGVLALAAVGFLIRYVQEKRLHDAAWAGVFCSLATATNYFTYPLVGAVVATVAVVNWREWKSSRAWRDVIVAGALACAYAGLFVLWYSAAHGWGQLMTQVGRLTSVASNEARPTFGGEIGRFIENVWTLSFKTPTQGPPMPWSGHDWWLTVAAIGFVFLPTRDWRLRLWVPFWLLVLMYGVFKKLNNVPLFFYPATIFLPLMAVGFAGVLTWAGELVKRVAGKSKEATAMGVACIVLAGFGLQSAAGAWSHFHTRIDMWTQQSATDAEAAMAYVNAHTAKDDFVIVPKQIYWLARCDRRSMLTFCARYKGVDNDMPVPTHIPQELYWFDCRLEEAKFLVLEYGVEQRTLPDGRTGQLPVGIDAVYTIGLRGVREVIQQAQQENWPAVFHQGAYLVLANPRFVKEAK
ncbi:MAG TPA: glycosyltransferase family 39 protein [Verrucomicrobiae bacterium]|nr:glycosyltransferase family 39 protein [Verrucomicrobiae bacterium]